MNQRKEMVISYSQSLEDVIIYDMLKDFGNISYIDCGANDSYKLNVTRLLYDKGIASGINIDPLQDCIDTYYDRKRDLSICAGLGRESGTVELYFDKG